MDRIRDTGRPSPAERPVPPGVAVTIIADAADGELVRFTIDGGDGTILRGPWSSTRAPTDGDAGIALETNGNRLGTGRDYWVVGVWPR